MNGPAGGPVKLSVVICTKDRPDGALAAARSVQAAGAAVDELVLVDQGERHPVCDALARAADTADLGRVRAVRDTGRGVASARNAGMRATRGAIVAFTDDDCVALPGWVGAWPGLFGADPRIAIAFGTVAAPEYDRGAGLVPAYQVQRPVVARTLRERCRIEGIGACMAIRRRAWEELGGFDEALGAGAPLRAAEEADFVVRALTSGWHAAETPEPVVVHHGFRTWQQGRELIAGYMVGLGAVNAKMLRLGGVRAIGPLAELSWRWVAGHPLVDLNQRPPRISRLIPFLRGMRVGVRTPLDGAGRFGALR